MQEYIKGDEVLLIKSKRRMGNPWRSGRTGRGYNEWLKREIFEESGIVAEPEKFVGIYQRLNTKDGYGPLEGMILPVVNLTFICKYIDGNENVSDESIEVGWFTPNIAKEKLLL